LTKAPISLMKDLVLLVFLPIFTSLTNSKYVMETLTDVQNYLNSVDSINEGGCGIAALAMYRWIMKNDEVKDVKFVFLYQESSFRNYVFNTAIAKNRSLPISPIAPTHVTLLINNKYVDVLGEFNDYEYDPIDNKHYVAEQIVTDEKFLIETIQNIKFWNSDFDRENVCDIVAELDVDLFDIFELESINF
jgi:hypothetical protein